MSGDLLSRARAWVRDVHPHALHLERTLFWLLELDPEAGEPVRIAAVTHDAERAFPDPDSSWDSAVSWDDPAYNRWHEDRCADIVAAWLREQGADPSLTAEVEGLVRVHEEGGWPAADLLQAADSLSFLDVMAPLVRGWVDAGRASPSRARGKLVAMYERTKPSRARALGAPLLERALAEFEERAA